MGWYFDIMIGGPGIAIAVPTLPYRSGYRKDHMARRGHHWGLWSQREVWHHCQRAQPLAVVVTTTCLSWTNHEWSIRYQKKMMSQRTQILLGCHQSNALDYHLLLFHYHGEAGLRGSYIHGHWVLTGGKPSMCFVTRLVGREEDHLWLVAEASEYDPVLSEY